MDGDGYKWHERLLLSGASGSGKSDILNWLLQQLRCQKLLLDTKPEFLIPGVLITRRVEDIDWAQEWIHYRPSTGETAEYEQLYEELYYRTNIVVCCHEAGDICEDQPGKAPRHVRRLARGGNIFGNGQLNASQRLVGISKQQRTEAQHIGVMVPGLDTADHKELAALMQISVHQLHQELAEAKARHGDYSSVWFNKGLRNIHIRPPLPPHIRRQILVQRETNLSTDATLGNHDREDHDGPATHTGPQKQPDPTPRTHRFTTRTR